MADSRETKLKRFESTAKTYEEKGKREWAYAKNGKGGEHYQYAKDAFNRAEKFRSMAEKLKK